MHRITIARVLAVHLGFHSLWVLLYCVSLLGVFLLIPLVGWYNGFVLGFLGKVVLSSPTRAALLGFVVFAVSGAVSGWLISLLRPKSSYALAFLSLAVTGVVLVSATWMRYRLIGVSGLDTILPLPASSGNAAAETLRWALKGQSLGELPPYLSGKGTVIPLADLQPSLSLLPRDFQLPGGPYVYCNLPPETWKALKKKAGEAKYPVLWSTQPDPAGKRLVFSVDLATDVFHDELVDENDFTQRINRLESAVREQGGQSGFVIPR